MNNLKQIGIALALYYDDHHQPPPSIASTNFGPYIGNSWKIFWCPSDSSKRGAMDATQFVSNPGLYCSYWYLLSKIPETNALTPVAWDRGVCEPGDSWPVKSPHKGEGGNILWSDGQVSWYPKFPTNRINTAGVIRFE
jgi:hypothetical protein